MSDMDLRRSDRRSALYAASLEIGSRSIPAKVRDHSEQGCRLALSENLRNEDLEVVVVRGDRHLKGVVAWRRDMLVGIRFDEPVPEGTFARVEPVVPAAAVPVKGLDQSEPFRRSGLKTEKMNADQARRGRTWALGHSPSDAQK